MADNRRTTKFGLFLLGVGVSAGTYWLWTRCAACRQHTKKALKKEKIQQIAVEDSFPASDPPASW